MNESSNPKKTGIYVKVLLFFHSFFIEVRENALFGTWGIIVNFGTMVTSRLSYRVRFKKAKK